MDERVHEWFAGLSPGEQLEVRAAVVALPAWLVNSMAESDVNVLELAEYLRTP
ncbi:MAG: hypothetical protein JWM34_4616 [Ilumatobacteraceae bacterium]|nr:hypothetical protein [Ilumatobacteraceae bacterium]